jgi:hypothetical protein
MSQRQHAASSIGIVIRILAARAVKMWQIYTTLPHRVHPVTRLPTIVPHFPTGPRGCKTKGKVMHKFCNPGMSKQPAPERCAKRVVDINLIERLATAAVLIRERATTTARVNQPRPFLLQGSAMQGTPPPRTRLTIGSEGNRKRRVGVQKGLGDRRVRWLAVLFIEQGSLNTTQDTRVKRCPEPMLRCRYTGTID